jgi:hypothetical protein
MTNTVQQEEQANPYNAKKDYHVGDKPFTPANQLYFEEPSEKNKLFDSDEIMLKQKIWILLIRNQIIKKDMMI